MSAAVVWTVGLTLLVDTVGPSDIAQMMGYVSLSMSLAILVAPLLGGAIYERGGYYAVFYLSFAMIVLDIILRLALIEKKIARRWAVDEPEDVAQTSTTENISTDPSASSDPTSRHPPEASSSGPLAGNRPPHPALTLLSSRRLLSALWCTLVHSILMTSWDATLPLRVSKLFGWNAVGAGLIFLPFVLPNCLAPVVGRYVDRRGPRLPSAVGFLLAVPPLVLLRLINQSGIQRVVLLCALLAFLGFALMMAMVSLLAEITYVVKAKEKVRPGGFGKQGAYAQAYGIYNCAFSGGLVLGPLWGGFLVRGAGWGTMAWSLGVLSAFTVLPATLWTGGWIGRGQTEAVHGASRIAVSEKTSPDTRTDCMRPDEV
jgi:MFS family permease